MLIGNVFERLKKITHATRNPMAIITKKTRNKKK
jgi:hypothetical protein